MKHFDHERCISTVSEILRLLKSTHQHEQVFHLIVDRVVRLYGCHVCALVMIDPRSEYLRVECSHGLSHTFTKAFRRPISTGAVGQLLWTGKPILLSNAEEHPALHDELALEHSFGSCVCVQVAADHRTLGYFYAATREKNVFTEDDVRILTAFADFAGVALHKCHLVEENMRLDRIDAESGLEKYNAFLERIAASAERAEPFAVILCDIDNFKATMQTYGYEASRALLKEMGDVVKNRVRASDGAARYGGDEFVILRSVLNATEAVEFATELARVIESTPFTQHGLRSTVSVGVAVYPQNGRTPEDLLLTAKKALFEAQRAGRNNVVHLPEVWYQHGRVA